MILTKKELNEAYKKELIEVNDKIFRDLASALVELQLLDKNGNSMILSENDKSLLVETVYQRGKKEWNNDLLHPGVMYAINEATQNLPQEDKNLLKMASKEFLRKHAKDCTSNGMAQGLRGKELKEAIQLCLRGKIYQDNDIMPKINKKLRSQMTKTTIATILLAAVMSMITGLPGKFTKNLTKDDNVKSKIEQTYDQNLKNDTNSPEDSKTISLADAQGLTVKNDATVQVPVDFDTGSAKLKPDQQQKIDDLGDNVLKNVKQRVKAGETGIVVNVYDQGNASKGKGDAEWNKNMDTGKDGLNKDRANSTETGLKQSTSWSNVIKYLKSVGGKVVFKKTTNDADSQKEVNPGSKDSEASETSFIGVNIDGKVPVKTDSTWQPGPTQQPLRSFDAPKVPPICFNKDAEGKEYSLASGDGFSFYGGNPETRKIQTNSGGDPFDGILTVASSDVLYKTVVLGSFKSDGSGGLKKDQIYIGVNVIEIIKGNRQNPKEWKKLPNLEGDWLIECGNIPLVEKFNKEEIKKEKSKEETGKEVVGKGEEKGKITKKVSKEELFTDISNIFKKSYTNRRFFGTKEKDACYNLKIGDEVYYKPRNENEESIFIVKSKPFTVKDTGKKAVRIQRKGRTGEMGLFAMYCSRIRPVKGTTGPNDKLKQKYKELISQWAASQEKLGKNTKPGEGTRKRILNQAKKELKQESIMKNNNLLTENLIVEGKYVKDPNSVILLRKQSKISPVKFQFFEDFLTSIDVLRKKIQNMDMTDDPKLNNIITAIKTNPLLRMPNTYIVKLFNVSAKKENDVKMLGDFINKLLNDVYDINAYGKKFRDLSLKASKIKLGESYLSEADEVLDKKTETYKKELQNFGTNTIKFMKQLVRMFAYLDKLREEGKLTATSGKPDKKVTTSKSNKNVVNDSVIKTNTLLSEEVNKIKSLMFKIS